MKKFYSTKCRTSGLALDVVTILIFSIMEGNIFFKDADLRSLNEAMPQVTNNSNGVDNKPKGGKSDKPKRKKIVDFKSAKNATKAAFKQVEWLASDAGGHVLCRQDLFKRSLAKTLMEAEGYSEFAFKKDLAKKMAMLLNDRKFHQKCWDAEWSLFGQAQILAWCNKADFDAIRDEGIDHVDGFDVPGIVVYEYRELRSELKALGFDDDFFKGDPYTSHYKENGGAMLR